MDSENNIQKGKFACVTFKTLADVSVDISALAELVLPIVNASKEKILPYCIGNQEILSYEALLHMAISTANLKITKRILYAWQPPPRELNKRYYWTGISCTSISNCFR
jgi:hypothetical protein